MSVQTINLSGDLYQYLLKNSLREPEILQNLRSETANLPHTAARMQISPEQGQFMGLLMRLLSAKKTLDIGTFTGYSALVVALNLPEEGKVITCDVNDDYTKMARRYWEKANCQHKIDLQLAPALNTLDDLIAKGEAGTFDFVFIDADKSNYAAYYEKALTLLKVNGLLAVDNVLWYGRVADATIQDNTTKIIRHFNEKIYADERVQLSMLPVGDGLTLALKL